MRLSVFALVFEPDGPDYGAKTDPMRISAGFFDAGLPLWPSFDAITKGIAMRVLERKVAIVTGAREVWENRGVGDVCPTRRC